MSTELYQDASLPIEVRLEDLLGRMTVAEKVGQMMQLDANRADLDDLISTQLVGSLLHIGGRMGEAIDLAAATRLGIPLLTADDCIHGHSFWPGATIFGTQLAMACSWDAALVERAARAAAVEIAATGVHWTFSPVLCIARDLRWGRVNETFGEDPVPHRRARRGHDPRLPGRRARRPDGGARLREALRRVLRDPGRSGRQRVRPQPPQAALVVPAAVRARGARGLPHVHARLPVDGRGPDHGEQVAALGRPQGRVGLHRDADHRLGQRRADGLGAEGLRRPRRGGRRRGPGGQRPGHDDARSSSRARRRPWRPAGWPRPTSTPPCGASCGSSSSWVSSRTRAARTRHGRPR